MEEYVVTGIVLNSMQYKEKDKLIHIFTVELGNITASLKGVASAKAKLKFAGQPFCFAKFDLTKSHDFYVVKNVELIDTFFDLTLDYDKYLLSSSMLEICNSILKPNIISESLFLSLIKTLQNIVYKNIDLDLSILKFYIALLEIVGYKLNFDNCDNCDMKFIGDIKFDFMSGTFRCSNCSGGVKINKQIFTSLKIVANTPLERLHTIKLNSGCIKDCVKLIITNICNKLNFKFKSINLENF